MGNNDRIRFMIFSALFIALVFVGTNIGIPWPNALGGYMHLGTLISLIIAIAFGKNYGALAAGIGMALFDYFGYGGAYAVWTVGTLITRFAMGYVVGYIAYDNKTETQGTNIIRNIIAILAGMIVMIIGYYLYEAIVLSNFTVALASIFGNVVQFILGMFAIVVVPLVLRAYEYAGVEKG